MTKSSIEWGALPSRRVLNERIDRFDVSADAKAAVSKLIELTVDIGGKLLEIGKAILAFVFDAAKRFPHMTFGVLVGLVVTFLIATVPVIGPPLSAFLAPFLVAFGLSMGALEDMWSGALKSEFEAFGDEVKAEACVG